MVPQSSLHQSTSRHLATPATPLHAETRAAVDTETAAAHLSRRPQTLRLWACKENGPIRPIRVHGRLAWPTAELRRLLECGGSTEGGAQ